MRLGWPEIGGGGVGGGDWWRKQEEELWLDIVIGRGFNTQVLGFWFED